MVTSMSKILYKQDKGHGQVSYSSPVFYQIVADPVLNTPESVIFDTRKLKRVNKFGSRDIKTLLDTN